MLLYLLSMLLVQFVANGEAICTPYNSSCTPLTAVTCCGFPVTLCLPDNRGSNSCLSPLDVQSLSPSVTAMNPFASVINQLETVGRQALNPATDPLANPILDPLANPLLNPLANPLLNPLAIPASSG